MFPFTNSQPCVQWSNVPPRINDFLIFDPWKALELDDPDLPADRFHLVSLTSIDLANDDFSYEILDSGACAFVEALAISACKNGQRVWFPGQPFGDIK